jgi:hypothetical protein
MKKIFTTIVLGSLLLSAGCAQTPTVTSLPKASNLASKQLAQFFFDYSADYEVPLSTDELATWSEFVVQGKIQGFTEGRDWQMKLGGTRTTTSTIMQVILSKVAEGRAPVPEGQVLYVEFNQSIAQHAEDFRKAFLVGSDVVLYLETAPDKVGSHYEILNPFAGRPSGQSLYRPVGPLGFAIEVAPDESIVWPLAQEYKTSDISEALPDGNALEGGFSSN